MSCCVLLRMVWYTLGTSITEVIALDDDTYVTRIYIFFFFDDFLLVASDIFFSSSPHFTSSTGHDTKPFILTTPGCTIPDFDPMHPSVAKFRVKKPKNVREHLVSFYLPPCMVLLFIESLSLYSVFYIIICLLSMHSCINAMTYLSHYTFVCTLFINLFIASDSIFPSLSIPVPAGDP